MHEPSIDRYRYFLKDTIRQEIDFSQTDQHRGIEPPPLEKPFPADAKRLDLPPVGKWTEIKAVDLTDGHRQPPEPPQFQDGTTHVGRTVLPALGHAGRT